jgi:hypothetical protein
MFILPSERKEKKRKEKKRQNKELFSEAAILA